MPTLNIALIGCGGRGTGAAANCLKSTKATTRLVAMADAFQDRRDNAYNQLVARFPNQLDVPPSRRFAGLSAFKNAIAQADAVVIATPPGFHPQIVEYAINQGKHVFVEKPVAVDSPGVRRIIASADLADRAGLSLGVGFQDHHNAALIATVKQIQSGLLGKMLYARGYYEIGGVWMIARQPTQSELIYQLRNWYYFTWLSGDHIVEQNCHVVSNVCWIKNSFPIACQGTGGRQSRTGKEYGQIYDHFAVDYEFEDGFCFHNRCRQMTGTDSRIGEFLIGSQGECEFRKAQITGHAPWTYAGLNPDAYQREIDDWIHSIVTKTPYNEGHHAARATLASIMGRMAAYSGQRVTWDEALLSNESLAPDITSFGATPPVRPDATGFYPIAMPGQEPLSVSLTPVGTTVEYTGRKGHSYQLESSSDLAGPWSHLSESITSKGDPESVLDPIGGVGNRFYRLRRRP